MELLPSPVPRGPNSTCSPEPPHWFVHSFQKYFKTYMIICIFYFLFYFLYFCYVFSSITILYSFDFLFYRIIVEDRGGRRISISDVSGSGTPSLREGVHITFQLLARRSSRLYLQFIRFYYFVFTCYYCVVLELVVELRTYSIFSFL